MPVKDRIIVRDAAENNLKHIDVEILHDKINVITGISGSGKSSLAYDIVFNEGQRRFLKSLSTHARLYLNKLSKPEVGHISGLKPAVAINQKTTVRNIRSTVGTLTGIYDLLRLLFARAGSTIDNNIKIDRSLFSFNTPKGACPVCNGLGVVDRIDPDLLIADPEKSIREGAFVITAPNGYIIYSQVTIDVLNQVCKAEGFNVDIPWKNLTEKQRNVVLYGSTKIKIPFGKHTLESRMKWSGITAKPREEGYYKGVIPIMEEILKRDRNKNILRFVKSYKCSSCNGRRLSKEALNVFYDGKNISDFVEMEIIDLYLYFKNLNDENEIVHAIKPEILKHANLLIELGLGYLTLSRESSTLSGGEAQRIRLANQVASGLKNILYVLDEPSAGLHNKDVDVLINILKQLRNNGNTIIVVEHNPEIICSADRIIDIGPDAGKNGGKILYQGTLKDFLSKNRSQNKTWQAINDKLTIKNNAEPYSNQKICLENGTKNNLKSVSACVYKSCFNVITGISGAGKTSFIEELLDKSINKKINGAGNIEKVIFIDQAPIGRTPRSNPATYTSVFDLIRNLFAFTAEAKKLKLRKNHFSFNIKGGRCEKCQGAGYIQTGMHFIGNIDVLCDDCNGKRFNNKVLSVYHKGKNIYDVLNMPVEEAVEFFKDYPRIYIILKTMYDLGLGYITLGQPATTLSGGEAQRIKLASELAKKNTKHVLYILDEPTTGLHHYDTNVLLDALNKLVEKKHTVICITHNKNLIANADYVIDIGPGSGKDGGEIVFSGIVKDLLVNNRSYTAKALKNVLSQRIIKPEKTNNKSSVSKEIVFKGIRTNNLKNIDVTIPDNKITVVTGVSGSGKSSFAFDTLYAEGHFRYFENFSAYAREHLSMQKRGDFDKCYGIQPAIAISQKQYSDNPRSTVGTLTEIYDYLRLLFSRANDQNETVLSSLFSFNKNSGACPVCKGLGFIQSCDPQKLVTNPDKSITDGAMDGTKTGKFYSDPAGQYIALLSTVCNNLNIDLSKPVKDFTEYEKSIVFYGADDKEYDVEWNYKRGNRTGVHKFKKSWKGFVNLVNDEYEIRKDNKRGENIRSVMSEIECNECKGLRLSKTVLQYTFAGENIGDLSSKSVNELIDFFNKTQKTLSGRQKTIAQNIINELLQRLSVLSEAGLGYLELNHRTDYLSAGEKQILKLIGLFSTELSGVLYVLDEPSACLHPSEYKLVTDNINRLINLGNTIVMVEHQPELIKIADKIIEFGHGSGRNGGEILCQGSLQDVASSKSLTAKLFTSDYKINHPNRIINDRFKIKGAFANNLKQIDVEFPLNAVSVITGVKGSGKTTLLKEVLYNSVKEKRAVNCISVSGVEKFATAVYVSDKVSGGSTNSNILTYTGLFDLIRDLFSATSMAKKLNIKKADFSFNQKGGRCEQCKGTGEISISMDFLPDVSQVCEECNGKRFKENILSCKIKGKNISDILSFTIDDLLEFLSDFPETQNVNKMISKLGLLQEAGLGYIVCGQSTSSFSGGEMQRLNLIASLLNSTKNNQLFLLDNPSIGLHHQDIEKLIIVFHKLVDAGNTVIIADNKEIIVSNADYMIELGPGGGKSGGEIINSTK